MLQGGLLEETSGGVSDPATSSDYVCKPTPKNLTRTSLSHYCLSHSLILCMALVIVYHILPGHNTKITHRLVMLASCLTYCPVADRCCTSTLFSAPMSDVFSGARFLYEYIVQCAHVELSVAV